MLDERNENALALMNTLKPKYTLIKSSNFKPSTNRILFLIDMNYILNTFRQDYLRGYASKIIEQRLDHNLAAEVINLLGHYRNYCSTVLQKYIDFYIFCGDENSFLDNYFVEENVSYVHNEKYIEELAYTSKYLKFVIEKRLKPISKLISGVHFISPDYSNSDAPMIDGATILHLFLDEILFKNKNPKVDLYMISNNPYWYSLCMGRNINLLRVNNKKVESIHSSKLFKAFSDSTRCQNTTVHTNYFNCSLTHFLACIKTNEILRKKDSPIPKLTHTAVMKAIEKVKDKLKNIPSTELIEELSDTIGSNVVDKTLVEVLFKYYDKKVIAEKIVYSDYYEYYIDNIVKQLKDSVADRVTLAEFNNKYYGDLINVNFL